jgi:hypothetical protein
LGVEQDTARVDTVRGHLCEYVLKECGAGTGIGLWTCGGIVSDVLTGRKGDVRMKDAVSAWNVFLF